MLNTAQARMTAKLKALGLPYRDISVYGAQIVVTCASRGAAIRWAGVLAKMATVKQAALPSVDTAKTNEDVNMPHTVKVWRTYATV
jgi:hypothetical protein